MPTEHILTLLIAERARLNRAIEALQGTKVATSPTIPGSVETSEPKKKRLFSAATRRKMALGQKKRYAALKAAQAKTLDYSTARPIRSGRAQYLSG